MWRKSSPCAYGRWSANSMPRPRLGVRRSARFRPANSRLDTTWRYSSFLRKSSWKRSGMALSASRGDAAEKLLDDRVRAHLVGLALEVQQEPVAERRQRDGADVVDRHERLAAGERLDFSAEDERLRRARAGAVAYVALHQRRGIRRLGMRSERQPDRVRLYGPGVRHGSANCPNPLLPFAFRHPLHPRSGPPRLPL